MVLAVMFDECKDRFANPLHFRLAAQKIGPFALDVTPRSHRQSESFVTVGGQFDTFAPPIVRIRHSLREIQTVEDVKCLAHSLFGCVAPFGELGDAGTVGAQRPQHIQVGGPGYSSADFRYPLHHSIDECALQNSRQRSQRRAIEICKPVFRRPSVSRTWSAGFSAIQSKTGGERLGFVSLVGLVHSGSLRGPRSSGPDHPRIRVLYLSADSHGRRGRAMRTSSCGKCVDAERARRHRRSAIRTERGDIDLDIGGRTGHYAYAG